MAQRHWAAAVSGNFNTSADWTASAVPGPADDAILDAPGLAAYKVTSGFNETVSSIQTAATATLTISGGVFTASNGTGFGLNAGTIDILNGATLVLEGLFANTGTTQILGGNLATTILIGAAGATLSGGGTIFLNFNGGSDQRIVGATDAAILTDVDVRISGEGFLGGGELTIVSEENGFIEAKEGVLVVDTGVHTIVNAGLIDAEGAPSNPRAPGQGVVQSPVENSGILESDGVGATMTFNAPVIGSGRGIVAGGTLRFNSTFNQHVDFEATTGTLALVKSATYTSLIAGFSKSGGHFLDLGDIAFVGAGEVSLGGTKSIAVLTVTDGVRTARIQLEGDYTGSAFVASSDGAGGTLITDEIKALHWSRPVNGVFGTTANWTSALVPGVGNDAILDASGATFTVTDSADVTVSSLQTAANSTLAITHGTFTATKGTGAGASGGSIVVGDGAQLAVGGTTDNLGTIRLNGAAAATRLTLGAGVILSGGGHVTLSDSSRNRIALGASGATNVDNTISGAGTISAAGGRLLNQTAGVISATGKANALVLDDAGGTVANAGLIQAAGLAGMRILGGTVDQTADGTIGAANSAIILRGASIVGGTLKTSGSGIIWAMNAPCTFDGTAGHVVTLAGDIRVANGGSLALAGSIVSSATIYVGGAPATGALTVGAGGAQLSGGGRLVLGIGAHVGAGAMAATLTNIDNRITGAGVLGSANLTLVNGAGGIINGNFGGGLLIGAGQSNPIDNAGEICATAPGSVLINGAIVNTGVLFAARGDLMVNGAVSGSGYAAVNSATLTFTSSFNENVYFAGASGVLRLAQSRTYRGHVIGFSKTGGTSLDLSDIAFGVSTRASYVGTAASGVLTITDGLHAAHIGFSGNYVGASFLTSGDGRGGTVVVSGTPPTASASAFVSAMATVVGPSAAGALGPSAPVSANPQSMLVAPGG